MPNNEEYCEKACNNYCSSSKAEQKLDTSVKQGSMVDKILEKWPGYGVFMADFGDS